MKMSQILLALLLCLAFAGAAPASAVTADFAGYCTLDYSSSSNTAYCSFHAQYDTTEAEPSDCPGSWISKIEWDFGSGYFEDDVFVTNSYPNAVSLGDAVVWVRVTCGDSSWAEASRLVIFTNFTCGRCINMNNGWD